MTTLVVDASVAAKWFFPEDYSAECRRLLAPQRNLLVPDLIWERDGQHRLEAGPPGRSPAG